MSGLNPLQLSRLVELREQELERCRYELAGEQLLRDRHLGTVRRLEALYADLGATINLRPELASNSAAYKDAMQGWIAQQRDDLALREAGLARARQALQEATRRQEASRQMLDKLHERGRIEAARIEQKHQDELAGTAWLRRQLS